MHTYIYTHICIYIRTYIHTYPRTHMNTCIFSVASLLSQLISLFLMNESMYKSVVVLSLKCQTMVANVGAHRLKDSPLRIRASLTFRSVPNTLFPSSRCRTATSRRRLTMRSGCATGPASCWPPALRKTRPSRRRRTFRPAAPASWPTCQSCRE